MWNYPLNGVLMKTITKTHKSIYRLWHSFKNTHYMYIYTYVHIYKICMHLSLLVQNLLSANFVKANIHFHLTTCRNWTEEGTEMKEKLMLSNFKKTCFGRCFIEMLLSNRHFADHIIDTSFHFKCSYCRKHLTETLSEKEWRQAVVSVQAFSACSFKAKEVYHNSVVFHLFVGLWKFNTVCIT